MAFKSPSLKQTNGTITGQGIDKNIGYLDMEVSPVHKRNCRYIKSLMTDAGLSIREDAMGNIFGRLEGSDLQAGKKAAYGFKLLPRTGTLLLS